MVRRIVLIAVSLSLLVVPSAHADSIYLPDISNLFNALAFNPDGTPPPDTFVIDLSGSAIGTVYDVATMTPLGNALVFADPADPDPTFSSGAIIGTPTPAALSISFDFTTAAFSGSVLTLLGSGTGLTPLDAALAAFDGPVIGTFDFASSTPFEAAGVPGAMEFYALRSIVGTTDVSAVPEPASLTLLGIGLAGAAGRRRKASK